MEGEGMTDKRMTGKIKRTDRAATALAWAMLILSALAVLGLLFGASALLWCWAFSMMGGAA